LLTALSPELKSAHSVILKLIRCAHPSGYRRQSFSDSVEKPHLNPS
jgi:hypothetical protein